MATVAHGAAAGSSSQTPVYLLVRVSRPSFLSRVARLHGLVTLPGWQNLRLRRLAEELVLFVVAPYAYYC